MKYYDDIDLCEDFAVMTLRNAMNNGTEISNIEFSNVIEIVRNAYYTATDSYKKKLSITTSIITAFLTAKKRNLIS